tara:strand:- start:336 stop:614 length:279 start_codon:yes stop_codon:yes gene_type:complete
MEYVKIGPQTKIYPGLYLYHHPTQQIVLCSSYFEDKKIIKAMANGHFIEDKIKNFRSIQADKTKRRAFPPRKKRCGSCKKIAGGSRRGQEPG